MNTEIRKNALRMKNEVISDRLSLFATILAALIIRIFLLELFFVPTGSMKHTILEGDYIFSTKYSYGFSNYSLPFSPNMFQGRILGKEPSRGDVIIFRPPNNMDIRYVKRLIGLPGEKVKLVDDVIYINDIPIKREVGEDITGEDGKKYKQYKETLPNGVSYYSCNLINTNHPCGNTKEFIVPENKYFFLGDNRDESNDSRFDLGFVPFENFIAKARFICFSTQKTLFSLQNGLTSIPGRALPWIESIRTNRIFRKV